jgi:hypothetical protein
MADAVSARERALRSLPLPYSLGLRLRRAGVATEVICEYLALDQASLNGFFRIAEAKLLAAQQNTQGRGETAANPPVPDCVVAGG